MQTISDPFILNILGAVADALDERGMSLLLTRLSPERRQQMPAMFDSGQVAGLIVIGQLTWHGYLNELAQRGIPMAVWGACLDDARYSVVGGDNATAGGYLATRHLLQQGRAASPSSATSATRKPACATRAMRARWPRQA